MKYGTTERGLDRLVNFSDAVAAVAMTLLVLPLVDLVDEGGTLGDLFVARGAQLGAYVGVFIAMVFLWSLHHRFWELVVDYDYRLMWMNSVWLLLLSLFPVIAGFTFENGLEDGQASAYLILFVLLIAVRVLMILYVRSRPLLLRSDVGPDDLVVRTQVELIGVYLGAVVVIALWSDPDKTGWVLGLAFAFGSVVSRIERTRQAKRRTEAPDVEARVGPAET